MRNKIKTADYYMRLAYASEVVRIPDEEGGGYNACIPLLGRWSAVGDGDTPEEAIHNLYASLPSLFGEWIKEGVAIPEPVTLSDNAEYSGKLLLRVPKSLHAKAAKAARAEAVSLNLFLSNVIAEAVGAKKVA